MLELKDVKKTYHVGDIETKALDGVSVAFREKEFVAILGTSGSGKTTCLNIIGGLDHYDSGDLRIKGKSTKDFKDSEWDAYRNNSIGFVFQSYNLISHLSIVANVELGMTLSNVPAQERHQKALEALSRVGLKEHLHKKPNQLSGGQMQRVAIARALANDPEILLCDEPTGALDSVTSIQIMDLIKEVAKDKLVIMVTHNPDLAEQYADRIIRFSDGKIIDDSHPHEERPKPDQFRLKRTSMKLRTALHLSFNNLYTKKGRTFLTAFASSIGIIGIAVILSLSTGFQAEIDDFQAGAMAEFPVIISQATQEGNMEEAVQYVYGEDYSASIAQINAIKEQFLADLDNRTSTEVNSLQHETEVIKMNMIAALIVVAVMQLLNMIIVRIRLLRPMIVVRDQMGEISQGNLSANFPLEANTSEIGMLVASIHETKGELKKYINDIDTILSQMADGKMDQFIEGQYRGEFLPIQTAMKQILDSLNMALSQIYRTAEQVSDESRKMTSDAQVLSSGAVKQASAVEQLSASIQELSMQVDRSSEDAEDARTSTSEATMQLEMCSEKMGALTEAMNDISRSSQQIGGIIKTIEDISFQTNILSLNAAVEAAHAGEAGKGFAVVAEEVSSLANKSSMAAKDITELIENSIRLVKEGTVLSSDTKQALVKGVSGAHKSTELVERIAESAGQQVQALHQLTAGMKQISEVVQTNATMAEKSASSAEELYTQAEELKVSVERFQLR